MHSLHVLSEISSACSLKLADAAFVSHGCCVWLRIPVTFVEIRLLTCEVARIGLGTQVHFPVLIQVRLVTSGKVAELAFVSLDTPMSVLVFGQSTWIFRAVLALVAFELFLHFLVIGVSVAEVVVIIPLIQRGIVAIKLGRTIFAQVLPEVADLRRLYFVDLKFPFVLRWFALLIILQHPRGFGFDSHV